MSSAQQMLGVLPPWGVAYAYLERAELGGSCCSRGWMSTKPPETSQGPWVLPELAFWLGNEGQGHHNTEGRAALCPPVPAEQPPAPGHAERCFISCSEDNPP